MSVACVVWIADVVTRDVVVILSIGEADGPFVVELVTVEDTSKVVTVVVTVDVDVCSVGVVSCPGIDVLVELSGSGFELTEVVDSSG